MSANKHKYTIVYKSGIRIHIQCDELETTHVAHHELRNIKAEGVVPRPFYLGMEEIESIWAGHL